VSEERQAQGIPEEVRKVARFLAFFAATRTYRPIDSLSRPFSFDDVVLAITDAMRQVAVYRPGELVEVRRGLEEYKVEVPSVPPEPVVQRFLEFCREDLAHAKVAAALALAYAPVLIKRERGRERERA